MKEILKGVGGGVLVAIVLTGLVFGAPYLQLQVMRMYGTAFESVKTDIYRENKSYVEGTIRDLRELRVDYVKAPESHKSAIAGLILQRANELDWGRLPSDVREFINKLKEDQ